MTTDSPGPRQTDSVRQRYDELGGRYDFWTRWLDALVVTRFRRDLLSTARGRVLEIAVGSGKNVRYYPADCELVGVDLSEEMLRVASKEATAAGRTLSTHPLDAGKLPFRDGSFDTVVCTLGGCTFQEPGQVFEEMRRVCAPEGQGLFLEHVRPRSTFMRLALEGLTPLTSRLLGCHPNRDTMTTVRAAGWSVVRQDEAARGMFVAAWGSPR